MNKEKGFTLVELLGVIIIIAILLLLIVPNVNKMIQNSSDNINIQNAQRIYKYIINYIIKDDTSLPNSFDIYIYDDDLTYVYDNNIDENINLVLNKEYQGTVTVDKDGIVLVAITDKEQKKCYTNFELSSGGDYSTFFTDYNGDEHTVNGFISKTVSIYDFGTDINNSICYDYIDYSGL